MGLGTRGFHSVRPDEIAEYRMATEYLLRRGHKRIGLVAMPRRRMPGDKQLSLTRQTHILAVLETLAEHGLTRKSLSAHFHRKTLQDPEGIGDNRLNIERIVRWLKAPGGPTGIVGMSDRLNSVRLAADLAGLRIGKDIDLIGIGDEEPAQQGIFPCISEQYDLVARHMVKLILEHNPEQAVFHVLIPPKLVEV
jgi:DNA-binding LacI/PurR family transcriptional regulator